jgi:chromosome segregation ATPase
MNERLDALRKKLDERLNRLERRIGGAAALEEPVAATVSDMPVDAARPVLEAPARELAGRLEIQLAENKDMHSRIDEQKREIDALKKQLAEQERLLDSSRERGGHQQADVAKLFKEMEQRLSDAEAAERERKQERAGEALERKNLSEEIAFLKAENDTYARLQREWEARRTEFEHTVQAKDREISRLFAKIGVLEQATEEARQLAQERTAWETQKELLLKQNEEQRIALEKLEKRYDDLMTNFEEIEYELMVKNKEIAAVQGSIIFERLEPKPSDGPVAYIAQMTDKGTVIVPITETAPSATTDSGSIICGGSGGGGLSGYFSRVWQNINKPVITKKAKKD